MRVRTTSALCALVCGTALARAAGAQHAPARSIAGAMTMEGRPEAVTIAGRATAASGKLQARVYDIAIQDETGGIRVFSRTALAAVREGDSVVARGLVKRYRGDLELVATHLTVVPTAPRLVLPRLLPIDARLIGRYPGQLVRVSGRVARLGSSEGGQWLRVRGKVGDRLDSLTLWVSANHGAPVSFAALQPDDSVIATGIVTAWRDNAEDAVVWQIVPRDSADVVLAQHSRSLPPSLAYAALLAMGAIGASIAIGRYVAGRQLRALRETDARYRQLLALTPDAVLVHARGQILFANPAAAQLLGITSDETLLGRSLAEFVHPDSTEVLHAAMGPDAPRTGDATRLRARFRVGERGTADVEITASPCIYHDQRAVLVLARDITAQLRYERDLHALALVDDLTGLHNRRGFALFAEQELARARRNGNIPILVFADLDKLKQINDQYGHAAGDAALQLTARALKSILREADIVARWSGDEFVALLGEGGEVRIEQIGERLDAALAALAPEGQAYPVTASVGTSPLDPALPFAEAMGRADAELYTQKKRDRRSVTLTPPHVDAVQPER